MADTQRLAVDLSLKGDFNKGMGKAQKNLKGFNKQAGAATKQTGKFSNSLRSMGKQAKGSILSGVGLGAGLVGFQLLTGAVSKFVNVMGDSVRMAAEEEAEIAQLTRAIEANDEAWDGNIDSVERLINERQKLAFSDGEQRESLRLLVAFTKDASKAQDILTTAMDFSRLQGISLKTSSELLGKAFAGNTATLSRYGIIVKKGASFTEILASVQKKADGQAKAYADTTAGKLTRAQIALDDAMQDLGRTITPITADLADLAADAIPDIVDATKDAIAKTSDFIDELVKLGRTASDVAGRDLENDLTNLLRIGVTGGLVIASDKAGDFGWALEDLQRQLQGVQRELVGVNEDFKSFTGEAERGRNAMATLPPVLGNVADAQTRAARTGATLMSTFASMTGNIRATTQALSAEISKIAEFQAIAADVAKTRHLGAINKAIERQTKLLAKAALAGNAKEYAKRTANLKELAAEKELARAGRKTVNAARRDEKDKRSARAKTKRQSAEISRSFAWFRARDGSAQDTLTAKIDKTTAALRTLDGVDPHISVITSGQGGSKIPRFASGTDYVPRTGLAVLHKGEAVIPADQNRGGVLPPIYVTPRIEVAASQVEQQTSRVVRTNRTRVNV